MKKIYFAIVALAALTLASCEKDPVGGTAVQALAGQWVVHVDGYDTKGDSVAVPFFNMEEGYTDGPTFLLLTYNNSNNDADKLYVNDMGNFWDFSVQAKCNLGDFTFGSKDSLENESYESKVIITNGKIVKNGAKSPSGAPVDYIQFDINFSDDDLYEIFGPGYEDYAGISWGALYGMYGMGFDVFRISGYRYTGLAADE